MRHHIRRLGFYFDRKREERDSIGLLQWEEEESEFFFLSGSVLGDNCACDLHILGFGYF